MTATDTRQPVLADQLAAPLTVAEPERVGALSVFPLIADRAPKLHYLAFAEAGRRGAKITELTRGADVNTLLVHNPLELPVLLYEGEEIQGAQQNRTIDISVLVAAHSKLRVPVSCVEQGRWDHRRHADAFTSARHTPHPELRRLKNEHVRERLAAGDEPRADQGVVWQEIAAKSARHGARSETGSLHDVFEHRRDLIDRAGREIEISAARSACSPRSAAASSCSTTSVTSRRSPRCTTRSLPATPSTRSSTTRRCLAAVARRRSRLPRPAARRAGADRARRRARRDAPFDYGGLGGTALAAHGELVTLTAFADKAGRKHH